MKNEKSDSKKPFVIPSNNVQTVTYGAGLNRRDALLKGLALLPIPAALSACGGGGDDALTNAANTPSPANSPGVASSADEINETETKATFNVLPSVLVPEDNRFQVEVVFCTRNNVEVFLVQGNAAYDLIASKPYTNDTSHAVGFCLFRCNRTDAGAPRASSFSIHVKIRDSESRPLQYLIAPRNEAVSRYLDYNVYGNGDKEYEWTFYDVVDGDSQRVCHVRFFPLAEDDLADGFSHYQNFMVIENTAVHQNDSLQTWLSPKLHETNISIPSHEAGVIYDGARTASTIGLPNPRHGTNHRELMPCYLEATQLQSNKLKRALERRYLRHMFRFKVKLKTIDPLDTITDKDTFHALGNEAFTIIGGSALTRSVSSLRTYLIEQAQIDANYTGVNILVDTYRDVVADMSNTAAETGTRDLRVAIEKKQIDGKNVWTAAGLLGLGVTSAVQFGGSYTNLAAALVEEPEIMGLATGAGFRISLGLNKSSAATSTLGTSGTNYKILSPTDGEYKLGIVVIAKGWASEDFKLKGISNDLEVTFSLTIKRGFRPRIDNIQIDAVIDLDASRFVAKLVRWYSPEADLAIAYAEDAVKFEIPTFIANSAGWLGSVLARMPAASSAFGFAFANTLYNLLGRLDSFWSASPITDYKTTEFSLFRVVIVNKTVGDPEISFTPKFSPVTWGWSPAVKYIAGVGIEYKREVLTSYGLLNVKGFIRHISVAELYGAVGGSGFVKALGYPISHA